LSRRNQSDEDPVGNLRNKEKSTRSSVPGESIGAKANHAERRECSGVFELLTFSLWIHGYFSPEDVLLLSLFVQMT